MFNELCNLSLAANLVPKPAFFGPSIRISSIIPFVDHCSPINLLFVNFYKIVPKERDSLDSKSAYGTKNCQHSSYWTDFAIFLFFFMSDNLYKRKS